MKDSTIKREEISATGFLRNVFVLMCGSGLAQVMPLVAAPVITRLYTPSEFGGFALFSASAGVLTPLMTGRYELAIVLPRSSNEARSLVFLALCVSAVSFAICTALFGADAVLGAKWSTRLGLGPYILLVPITATMTAAAQALQYWSNRHQEYRRIATSRVSQAIVGTAATLAFGVLGWGAKGLILASLLSQGTSILVLYGRRWPLPRIASIAEMTRVANSYYRFPLFSTPADVMNVVSYQLPVFLLGSLFGPTIVGQFALAQRVLSVPTSLLSASVPDVFRQTAAKEYAETGQCAQIYIWTLQTLLKVTLPIFLAILLTSPLLFSAFFGKEWETSGAFAASLALLYFPKWIVSPLSYMYYIAGRQAEDLVLHVVMIAGSAISILFAAKISSNPTFAVLAYSLQFSVVYSVYLLRSYQFAVSVQKNN